MTPIDTSDPQTWPPELDAMHAAPDYHTLLMENERVRVLDTLIPPGHKTAVHTHRWPAVFHILSWSDFVRYDDHDNVMVDTRDNDPSAEPPTILWSEPIPPHALENVGDAEIHLISVEVKD